MKIRVTQEHIAHGSRCMPDSCAIARAIAEAIPGSEPDVGSSDITLKFGGWYKSIVHPPLVAEFVRRFDDGETPQPFEFELAI